MIVSHRDSPFTREAMKVHKGFGEGFIALTLFWPALSHFLHRIGFGTFPKDSLDFFQEFVDEAMANRKSEGAAATKRNDFLQLMINAEDSADSVDWSNRNGELSEKVGLTRAEIQVWFRQCLCR